MNLIYAQNTDTWSNNPKMVTTKLGEIACYERVVEGSTPIVFLHGVYYDHSLWNDYIASFPNHTLLMIDMPLHGKSKNSSKKDWTLSDCNEMLVTVLDTLGYTKVYGVGHSWGGMTLLRTAVTYPDRFKALGFINMPIDSASKATRIKFKFQHLLLPLRKFYTKQVAKALFSKSNYKNTPEFLVYLRKTMGVLSNKEIRSIDCKVILESDDGRSYLKKLIPPALAISGKEDYISISPLVQTKIIEGGHTSPLENPKEVLKFIKSVLQLNN